MKFVFAFYLLISMFFLSYGYDILKILFSSENTEILSTQTFSEGVAFICGFSGLGHIILNREKFILSKKK